MRRTLLLALLLAGTATSAQAQDLIIRGGPIYTGVDGAPTAEVVQVRDGRIAYVGPARGAPDAADLE
ncbi:MAG TPA: amidohydrolase, partial [Brevundimonas sp.]|nr:amidohydrolase [Brevundimonas sp.]